MQSVIDDEDRIYEFIDEVAQGTLHAVRCVLDVFFSSRRRHTRLQGDWSSDVCSSDLAHSSLLRAAGEDPKVVADQLGHGIGTNLDVYTTTSLERRLEGVNKLAAALRIM